MLGGKSVLAQRGYQSFSYNWERGNDRFVFGGEIRQDFRLSQIFVSQPRKNREKSHSCKKNYKAIAVVQNSYKNNKKTLPIPKISLT
jgi:hypothetical protein